MEKREKCDFWVKRISSNPLTQLFWLRCGCGDKFRHVMRSRNDLAKTRVEFFKQSLFSVKRLPTQNSSIMVSARAGIIFGGKGRCIGNITTCVCFKQLARGTAMLCPATILP